MTEGLDKANRLTIASTYVALIVNKIVVLPNSIKSICKHWIKGINATNPPAGCTFSFKGMIYEPQIIMVLNHPDKRIL